MPTRSASLVMQMSRAGRRIRRQKPVRINQRRQLTGCMARRSGGRRNVIRFTGTGGRIDSNNSNNNKNNTSNTRVGGQSRFGSNVETSDVRPFRSRAKRRLAPSSGGAGLPVAVLDADWTPLSRPRPALLFLPSSKETPPLLHRL